MMLANTIPPLSATAAHINPNNGLETVWRAILIKLIDTAMMNFALVRIMRRDAVHLSRGELITYVASPLDILWPPRCRWIR
jgi:hypothetical protein